MGLWEKIKSGVKGFVKSVIHYVPRGILLGVPLSAAFLGLSSLVGFSGVQTTGEAISYMANVFMLGGLISGGVGAFHQIKADTQKYNAGIAGQPDAPERGSAPQQQIDIGIPAGLPQGKPLAANISR